MSLSKQLGLSFLLVLLLVFIGTLWVNVHNTRDFIEQQLRSHAQDTATSLGLSITPYLDHAEDLPIVETMTNAIFDNGYYAAVLIKDAQGNVLINKQNPTKFEDVPQWFSELFSLTAPSAQTELNNGWNIAGTLVVTSNPGFGYQQLWDNAVALFGLVTLIFLLALLLVWFLVRLITQPLLAVVSQASAISNKHFDQVHPVPKTPELRVFVEAINNMSQKLAVLFKQITQTSDKYREYAYTDTLTHFGNRRAFDLALFENLANHEDAQSGYVMLVRLASLNDVNQHLGASDGDNYITSVAECVQHQCRQIESHFSIFRISGADFAVIFEDIKPQTMQTLVADIVQAMTSIEKSEYSQGIGHVGVTEFHFGDKYKDVMEKADSALLNAASNSNHYQFADELTVTQGNQEWRQQIQNIITTGTSDFAAQNVVDSHGTVLYEEWFARLPNKSRSENIPMAQLIPASIRLDYAQDIDRMIVNAALQKLALVQGKVGLNISRLSLLNISFQSWLLFQLTEHSALQHKLVLEIPERALVNDAGVLVEFIAKLKSQGVQITVERFGAQLAGIGHLREIQPDYVKIDGRYIRDIDTHADNQLFIQSLVGIAHGLNIKLIAEMVETQAESDYLRELGVDYQQGYFLGAPRFV